MTSRTAWMTVLLLGALVSPGFFRVPAWARAGSSVRSARMDTHGSHRHWARAATASFCSCPVVDEVARHSREVVLFVALAGTHVFLNE